MQLDKESKFCQLIEEEIKKDFDLAGIQNKYDKKTAFDQAFTIARELCSDYPNLTLSYLQLLPKIIRKRGERVNWQSIVKALNSHEYQDDLKKLIEQEKALRPKLENKEEYYTVLEQSVLSWFVDKELSFKDMRCSVEEYHKIFYSNIERVRNLALDYVHQLKLNGWQDHQQFRGTN
jgi:hypothetical protein